MDPVSLLMSNFWAWRLLNYPEFATAIGYHIHDNRLDDLSLDAYKKREQDIQGFLKEITNLTSLGTLSAEDRFNLLLLRHDLEQVVSGLKFKSYLFPVNQLEGPQVDFPRLISYMKTENIEDYGKILQRYRLFPQQIDQIITLLGEGLKTGYVMSNVSVNPVPDQISGLISQPIEDSPFFKPFAKKTSNLEDAKWKELTAEGKKLIESELLPSFRKLKTFLENDYMPKARLEIGAAVLPNGKEYYQKCLEFHTTTNMTAVEIHDLGKLEVERISKRMLEVKTMIGFSGSLSAFRSNLRQDPKYSFKTRDEILETYGALCKSIEEKLPLLFNSFPKAKLQIIPVPEELAPNFPGAYYIAPPGDGSRPGTFYVNTYEPETRKRYEVVSLALHEAIPGHHHQSSLSVELKNVPDFRRYLEDRNYYQAPGRFAMNTAYIEGWGLYSEYLGEEMNLYTDPYNLFGRLSHEMLRAVRLVVDTGMHALGWSREDAITYMTDNTAMSGNDVVAEVERYITWPGQACAYKAGELKLKELREKAKKAVGSKFDIRKFHDMLLLSGSLPLSVLEQNVENFISENVH